MSWKSFPKVELHLHLEVAADPAFIRELAVEKSVDTRKIFDKHLEHIGVDCIVWLMWAWAPGRFC